MNNKYLFMKKLLIIFSAIIIVICLFNDVSIIFAKTAEEIEAEAHANSNASSEIIQEAAGDYGVSGQQITGTDSTTSSGNSSSSGGSGTIPLPAKPANLPQATLEGIIDLAIRIIFAVGEIGFVVVFLIAGVTFITAAGDEAKVGNAKKMLTWAVVGIIVLLAAYGIAEFIISNLGGSSSGSSGASDSSGGITDVLNNQGGSSSQGSSANTPTMSPEEAKKKLEQVGEATTEATTGLWGNITNIWNNMIGKNNK